MRFHFFNFSQCVCLGIKRSTKLQISKSTPKGDKKKIPFQEFQRMARLDYKVVPFRDYTRTASKTLYGKKTFFLFN